ncbi:MAG TPA: CPBP family intramembrane glutamic endopeptidase [Trebonia sp.]|jgi:membrane protease YdiL (CAAX protease family)|nr:CPBP family intramembrane glutamic endopeptidase [Trebonia sp.]
MPPVLWISPRLAVVITVVILVIVNVIDVRVPHASLVAGPVCAALLLWLARLAGLSWAELGLGPGTWRRGLTWAAAIIGIAAIVLAVGAALPLTRDAFRDSRYHLDLAQALLTAFVLIPVGTVLLEEVAFRGVLWGLLRRIGGTAVATAVSSALFGLWHILPSLGLATDNEAIGSAVGQGRSAQVIAVLGTVLFTAGSGVVFCELRRRSGSLLAPAGLHWAVNGLSVLASAAVWAWATR